MLLVGNQSRDHSIITGEYINTLDGTHSLILTVYGDAACSGVFEPCSPQNVEVIGPSSGAVVGPGLDWSDKETLMKSLKIPVYNSTSLSEMITNQKTLPPFIYHEDIGAVVDTSTIRTVSQDNSKLQDRQGCATTTYYAYWNEGAWSEWTQWVPTSGCLFTGYDSSGGTLSLSENFGWSYAESLGFGGSGILSALSESFTFTVTESYSWTWTQTCNIAGDSVGEVYTQQLAAYGYAYQELCYDDGACGISCGDEQGPNYSGIPEVPWGRMR